MSTGQSSGFLSYDPNKTGTSGAILASSSLTGAGRGVGGTDAGAGGGKITGAGTYYSHPSTLAPSNNTDVSEIVSVTGTLAGTMTVEVSNGSEDLDRNGQSVWVTYDQITLPAILGPGQTFGIEARRLGFSRYRLKFVYSGGSGTIESRRVIKGS